MRKLKTKYVGRFGNKRRVYRYTDSRDKVQPAWLSTVREAELDWERRYGAPNAAPRIEQSN
jgi:hypothetical protein